MSSSSISPKDFFLKKLRSHLVIVVLLLAELAVEEVQGAVAVLRVLVVRLEVEAAAEVHLSVFQREGLAVPEALVALLSS